MTERPLSFAMASALRAVARMKGDGGIVWYDERADTIAPMAMDSASGKEAE